MVVVHRCEIAFIELELWAAMGVMRLLAVGFGTTCRFLRLYPYASAL